MDEALLDTIVNLNRLIDKMDLDDTRRLEEANALLDQIQDQRDEEIFVLQSILMEHPELKPAEIKLRARYREQHNN